MQIISLQAYFFKPLVTICLCFGLISYHDASVAASDCDTSDGRIFGGQDVQGENAPWTTLIETEAGLCTGVLIDRKDGEWSDNIFKPRFMLSAFHCFEDVDENNLASVTITTGVFNKCKINDGVGQKLGLADKPIQFGKDLALVKLKYPDDEMKLAKSQRKSIVPASKDQHQVLKIPFTALDIYGWGQTKGGQNPTILQTVRIPIIDSILCRTAMGKVNVTVSDDQFCAGFSSGQIDSCFGDSGGPAVYKVLDSSNEIYRKYLKTDSNLLVGVVAEGFGCAFPNVFGVYSSLESYIDQIGGIIDES